MTQYIYRAVDSIGKTVRGTLEATNVIDLEQRLRRLGLDLVDFKESKKGQRHLRSNKVERRELINFFFHMEQLTEAGIPLIEALQDIRDSIDNHRFREVVSDIVESIESGLALSAAMQRHPYIFTETITSMVATGEHTGALPQVFRNLSEALRWQDELVAHTKKILTYPAFVALVVIGVTVFLMVYLVPQLTTFIKSSGNDLPLYTRALLFVSNVFIHYWYVVFGLPVVIVATLLHLRRTNSEVRYRLDNALLRTWIIGPMMHKVILARFATFFGMMYGSGISVLECIRLSEDIVNNKAVASALRRAHRLIEEGKGISEAFQITGMFSPLVIRMLRIGELTGSLDTALKNVSYFYNREIKERIERLQALIEPAMTVTLGLILGWIMLSILGPIYDAITKVKF